MAGLFRSEALDYQRAHLEGEVAIRRSVPQSLLTALFVATTLALCLWAFLGRYTRTETVPGAVTPAGVLSKVYADRPGQVTWLGVKEGDLVRKGQPIATISTEQDLEGGASPDEERLTSVAQQSKLLRDELGYEDSRAHEESERLRDLITDLADERQQISAQIKLQRQAVKSTRSSFDAMTDIVSRGFETKTDYEQRRQIWLTAATQLQSLVQQLSQLDERLSQARSDLTKLPSEHAAKLADLSNNIASLTQRRIDIEGSRSYSISAPISGRVTAVQVTAGRNADGKLPLLAIVPEGERMEATLYAPSRAIGMAHIGQPVRLMYDAFPYQRFGTFTGRIVRISHSVLAPNEVDTAVKLEDPTYELGVAIDRQTIEAFGDHLKLQPGMTLTADIVLDRQSFVDWLLQPILAVRARS